MKRNPIRAAFGLALAIGAFSSALAQFSGSISGTVTDPAGAVIPGATVTLTNVGTGEGKTAPATRLASISLSAWLPAATH